jgi:hypothetical protein
MGPLQPLWGSGQRRNAYCIHRSHTIHTRELREMIETLSMVYQSPRFRGLASHEDCEGREGAVWNKLLRLYGGINGKLNVNSWRTHVTVCMKKRRYHPEGGPDRP